MKSIFKSSSIGGGDTASAIASHRNRTYRGENLTSKYTSAEILSMVRSGTFDDLYLGDIIGYEASASRYRPMIITGFNIMTNHGNDNKVTKNNIVVMTQYVEGAVKTTNGYYKDNYIYTLANRKHLPTGIDPATIDYKITSSNSADKINTLGSTGSCDGLTSDSLIGCEINEINLFGTTYVSSNKYYDNISLPKRLPFFDDGNASLVQCEDGTRDACCVPNVCFATKNTSSDCLFSVSQWYGAPSYQSYPYNLMMYILYIVA